MNVLSPDVTINNVWQEAIRLTIAGISILPIAADGSKDPAFSVLPTRWDPIEKKLRPTWNEFKEHIATAQQIDSFYKCSIPGKVPGIGVICGKVSGGLEAIDADDGKTAEAFLAKVKTGNPDLYSRLVLVQSPRPGLHMYYRCTEFGGNCKLARIPDPDKNGLAAKCIIEVKGEGGVCTAPGSPAYCHKKGMAYQYLQHHLTQVPTITIDERNYLLECARSLNTWVSAASPLESKCRESSLRFASTERPGDKFNRTAEWVDILTPHGWKLERMEGGVGYWRRPGKSEGNSATTNYMQLDRFYVFTTSADSFDPEKSYSKFETYVRLNHNGDFHAAAQALIKKYRDDALSATILDGNSFRQLWAQVSRQSKLKS